MGALSMRTQQLPFALAAVLAHALVACLGSAASPVASDIIPEEDWAPSVSELELVQQNWVDCVSRAPEAKTKCLANSLSNRRPLPVCHKQWPRKATEGTRPRPSQL